MAYKGKFKPRNTNKYKGNPTNIIYRSLWELKLMRYLDEHPDVVSWSSEEIAIPYKSPIDGRYHRYFPDFKITKKDKEGSTSTLLVEVKPLNQTRPPEVSKKITKKYINEVATWGINQAKWKAAADFCEDRNWKFSIMTEKELGI